MIRLFNYLIIPLLLIFASSCAKEIYTNEDAARSQREAQKVGLTLMIRDISSQVTDMSGFTVTTTQCGELIQGITTAHGIVSLMVVKGDAVLQVEKEGYVTATAVVTTRATEKDRNNTVMIIPVFSDQQASGSLQGMVSVAMLSSDDEPLADALVSIDVDINEMICLAFPGMRDIGNYLPGTLVYSSANLMQPVRTDVSGVFRFAIPVTINKITYTVNVHETALTPHTFCSASQTVVTNGQNSPTVLFRLMPYEK